jgi:transposase InsO family protein
VVALARVLGSGARAARDVGISERTATAWALRWREERLAASASGPEPRRADREERRAVRALLFEHGPSTGVERLLGAFPGLSFAEGLRLKREWLRQSRRVARRYRARLCWQRPGRVWAADFTDLEDPLESGEGSLLVVRDLSSGNTLWAGPCHRKDAKTAHAALLALFLEHGAPLALKLDNAKAFRSRLLRGLLCAFGVTALYSPRWRPPYNGSCESGIGHIKDRASYRAERRGRRGAWSARDVEEARTMGNETLRPGGARGPTPAELFAARTPITQAERTLFQATVARYLDEEQSRRGHPRGGSRREAAERAAVRRALVDLGYLHINTRRVSPPIQPLNSANNS